MGGNVKYKQAKIRTNLQGEPEMRDNGSISQKALERTVSRRAWKARNTVQKNNRQNNNRMANRMKDSQAVKEVRNMAKRILNFNTNMKNMSTDEVNKQFPAINADYLKLSQLAKQVDQNVTMDEKGYVTANDIEKILGVKVA